MHEYQINTNKRCELIRVDQLLNQAIAESGLNEGALVAYVPHTTAGILINENADPAVVYDILNSLEKQVPFSDGYTHMEGNSAAHIKASLVGSSVHIPVSDGKPRLGTWQSVFFAEFDGPRRRKMWITPLSGHSP